MLPKLYRLGHTDWKWRQDLSNQCNPLECVTWGAWSLRILHHMESHKRYIHFPFHCIVRRKVLTNKNVFFVKTHLIYQVGLITCKNAPNQRRIKQILCYYNFIFHHNATHCYFLFVMSSYFSFHKTPLIWPHCIYRPYLKAH